MIDVWCDRSTAVWHAAAVVGAPRWRVRWSIRRARRAIGDRPRLAGRLEWVRRTPVGTDIYRERVPADAAGGC